MGPVILGWETAESAEDVMEFIRNQVTSFNQEAHARNAADVGEKVFKITITIEEVVES